MSAECMTESVEFKGATPCPLCGRHWLGRLTARRPATLMESGATASQP